MIERIPFGSTGHDSTRTVFGAAALAAMKPKRAQSVLEMLLEFGVDHIDTAAAYGEAELRLAPWLRQHRERFFLATKTGERTRGGAHDQIEQSLRRMEVDQIDLIQLHNLVDEREWQLALSPGGALEACLEAREQGRVRFIGVTGHGTRVAAMHLRSLERFAFDSVLLPYNHAMMSQPEYARDFEELYRLCRKRGVALQTIKSLARRRWRDDDPRPRYSWYEPLREPEAIRDAVRFVLQREGIFLNTSSDATLLRETLDAASRFERDASAGAPVIDAARYEIEPLFVRGVSDSI